jgi:hypothetical protein
MQGNELELNSIQEMSDPILVLEKMHKQKQNGVRNPQKFRVIVPEDLKWRGRSWRRSQAVMGVCIGECCGRIYTTEVEMN